MGFRPWVFGLARRWNLTGWVRNDEQGVLLEVQGEQAARLSEALLDGAPPLARIDAIEVEELPPRLDETAFTIDPSAREGAVRSAIGPDAGVCRACLAELCDPADRRYRYPFLNCTHCGPRYTITRGLPYDRPQTSMAGFAMCSACAAEYADPTNRRFHAQPVACPNCGPRLSHSLEAIVACLRGGGIAALKGLGGYLLACDARSQAAVTRLRLRKQRDGKPFAVMVANLASARCLVGLGAVETELLTSWRAPIVLARRLQGQPRPDAAANGVREGGPASAAGTMRLAEDIAPDLAWLGVMLPSTPLHMLLFHEAAGRPDGTAWLERPLDFPLVMTSANPGGRPLLIDDAEACERLATIADLVVSHDRAIVVRADDSVARVVANGPTLIRRARGYVPEPVSLHRDVPPVLALGAHLKMTFCLTRGKEAFLSQHLGDLDDSETFRFLEETLAHLTRTLEVKPVAVAHDLHPDFLSTRKAQALAQTLGVPTFAVQHHHAHLAAVLAEHGCEAPTVGLALDGFGLGANGQSWGGELLLLEGPSFERLGHLRPLRQPGGDLAARQPWRMAAAALHALGRRELPARCRPSPDVAGASATQSSRGPSCLVEGVFRLLDEGTRAPWTTSCGRLFDAACGLLGIRPTASYEGEAPMVLESLVRRPHVLQGAWRVVDGTLDLLPLLERLLELEPSEGADAFHGTLAAALAEWALPRAQAHGGVVALGGGCVMNRSLTELLVAEFQRHGVRTLLPRAVPANDGGLSLGQAWVTGLALQG